MTSSSSVEPLSETEKINSICESLYLEGELTTKTTHFFFFKKKTHLFGNKIQTSPFQEDATHRVVSYVIFHCFHDL